MLVFPLGSIYAEHSFMHAPIPLMMLTGKWFAFWAGGVRLFIAGLRQSIQPRFTSETIFGIKGDDPLPFIQELGLANISMGTIGFASLFVPPFVLPAAIVSGLYYGLAGIKHVTRGGRNFNENVAMISDLLIFFLLAGYIAYVVLTRSA